MQFNSTDEQSESSQQEKKDQEHNLQQQEHQHHHHQLQAPLSHDDSTTLYHHQLPPSHGNDDLPFLKPSLAVYRNNQARQIMASASTASPMQFAPATAGGNTTMSHSTSTTPTQLSTEIFQPYNNAEYQLQTGGGSLSSPANTIPSYTSSSTSQQSVAGAGKGLGHQRSSSTSSMHPPPQYASRPRVTTMLWEDEGTLCFQVEAKGICVARREDNDMINGTKLLNLAGLTRGRRDGILKTEKVRHVVKVGAMHLKGVWIPFERALEFANKEKITDMLHPLFVYDLKSLLYNPTSDFPRSLPAAQEEPASTAAAAAAAAEETIKSAQATPEEDESAIADDRASHDDRQYGGGEYSFALNHQSSQPHLPSMSQQTSDYSNTQGQQQSQQQQSQSQPQARPDSPSNSVPMPSQNHPSSYTYDFRMQLPTASYMPMYRNPAPVNAVSSQPLPPPPPPAQAQMQMSYYQPYPTDQQALPQMHMPMYQHAAPPSGPPPNHPSHQQHLHHQAQQPLQSEYHSRPPSAPISRVHSPTLPLHQQEQVQQQSQSQSQPTQQDHQQQQQQQHQPAMHYYSHPAASSHSLDSNAGLYDERPTMKRMKSDH